MSFSAIPYPLVPNESLPVLSSISRQKIQDADDHARHPCCCAGPFAQHNKVIWNAVSLRRRCCVHCFDAGACFPLCSLFGIRIQLSAHRHRFDRRKLKAGYDGDANMGRTSIGRVWWGIFASSIMPRCCMLDCQHCNDYACDAVIPLNFFC